MKIYDQQLLALIPRAPDKRSTADICAKLAASGLDISVRSVQRRLIELARRFPIQSDERSKPFGWSLTSDAPAEYGDMSIDRALAFKLMESQLRMAVPDEIFAELRPQLAQADHKLKAARLHSAWLKKFRVIPQTQELIPARLSRDVMSRVYRAVFSEQRIAFLYRPIAGDKREHIADPLAVVLRGTTFYLIARLDGLDRETIFAMHRIEKPRILEDKLRRAGEFDLASYLKTGALDFFPSKIEKVRLRFFEAAGRHLNETKLTEDQILIAHSNDEHTLEAMVQITEQLKWWLHGFADKVMVEHPKHLRDEFASRAKSIADLYRQR